MKSCPYLPLPKHALKPSDTRVWRDECGPNYYQICLECAQSLWQAHLPAQALLQLNKSFMCQLDPADSILQKFPLPYRAIRWMLANYHPEDFIGNPVRHFQHLASRMSAKSPQAELRTWRAWACYHIASRVLDHDDFPPDEQQIRREKLSIPSVTEVSSQLEKLGLTGEVDLFKREIEK